MKTSPAPVLMPAPEWFLYYLQQEGRRKFLKDGTEASMCQQERNSTDMPSVGTCLTWQNLCHKDSAASLRNLGSILSQIADFVNWQKKHGTDISARMSIVLVKLIKWIWFTSTLFFCSVIFIIWYLAVRNYDQENSVACGCFGSFFSRWASIKSIKKQECDF